MIHKFAEIARDVGSASRIKRLASHFYNRHGSLGRDAADFSPNEFVQHQIANHNDSLGRCAIENPLKPVEIHTKARWDAARATNWFDSNELNCFGDDLCTAGVLLKVCSINPEYEPKINNRSRQ